MGEFSSKIGSRRGVLRAGAAVLAGGVVAAGAVRAQDQKVAQELVQYQNMPKDGAKCSLCAQWQPPNACAIVAGVIDPNGWCVAYAAKEG